MNLDTVCSLVYKLYITELMASCFGRDVFNDCRQEYPCRNIVVDSCAPEESCINLVCTLAPPGEYGERLCAAAISGSATRGSDVAVP